MWLNQRLSTVTKKSDIDNSGFFPRVSEKISLIITLLLILTSRESALEFLA